MNTQALALTSPSEALTRIGEIPPRYGVDEELGEEGPAIDFKAIWSTIVRNGRLISLILLISMTAGAATIIFTKPMYRAEATIQIEPQPIGILGAEGPAKDLSRIEVDRSLQTQVDILKSRTTADSVASKLNLAANPEFLRDAGLTAPSSGAVASALQRRLAVSLPRDTRVIRLTFDSHSPEFAATAANTFAETFIAGSLQRRLDTYSYSRNFLQSQLAQTKGRLAASERSLISYARSAGLIDASDAAGGNATGGERRSLTTASLVDLNSAYSQARAGRVQSQQRWQQALSTPLMSLPEVLANPTIQNLTRQRAELQASFQEERQRHKEEHPAIIQAAARLQEIDRQIGTIASAIRASIGDQYRVAQRQEGALQGNVGQLKSAAFAEQDKGVKYNILKREVDTNRNLYNSLLQRFNEVSTQAADTNSPISIIDRALAPATARYPRPVLNMALAILGGLILALLVVFGRTKLDDYVHGPANIERDFRVPLLGLVPLLKGPGSVEQALADPRSHITEAHHAISLALDFSARMPNHTVLLLTSSKPNEGKSTTAFKLATDFAAAGKQVLLIDGDMRRGSLHQLLGVPNKTGLSNILSGTAEGNWSQSVQTCEPFGFAFIARGRSRCSPAELLASERFVELLKEVTSTYDVVIIDGPPVMGLADAPRLAAMADATIFMVEANRASRGNVKIALNRLAGAGANRIGIVLTKYDPALDGGNYGYAYSYDYDLDERSDEAEDVIEMESEVRRELTA